jgi:AcrR family transcriptional regulator
MTTPTNSPARPLGSGSRMSADERRAAVVAAGIEEFAAHGLTGASTEAIARRAGVSQPYVFQLFKTKQELFLAIIRRCFERVRLAFEDAASRQERGTIEGCNTVLDAMGREYMKLLADRTLLLVQLQAYAASSDPQVRTVVREEYGRLYRFVAEASGADAHELHDFFAEGMLLNVGAAIGLPGDPENWKLSSFGGGA